MDEVIFLISLNLGPAAGPVQAITIALQLPIIETRVTILLGLARADGPDRVPEIEVSSETCYCRRATNQTPYTHTATCRCGTQN